MNTQFPYNSREEHALHRKVHRPWGWYDSIDDGLEDNYGRSGRQVDD